MTVNWVRAIAAAALLVALVVGILLGDAARGSWSVAGPLLGWVSTAAIVYGLSWAGEDR